jgi:hypothetical protein
MVGLIRYLLSSVCDQSPNVLERELSSQSGILKTTFLSKGSYQDEYSIKYGAIIVRLDHKNS